MRLSTASEIGLRGDQEDRFLVHRTDKGTLYAVMDGHGGASVAEVCREYLPSFWDLSVLTKEYGVLRPYPDALGVVIWQLDSITNEYHAGSTISLALVPKGEDVVHFATLGDSPVIVRSPQGVCKVSTSHNVRSNIDERIAAINRGGEYYNGYIWNGVGDLAEGVQMGRALGDCALGPILSKTPDIETHEIGDFLLLATDGVFDSEHCNEKQAIADVVRMIDSGGTAETIVQSRRTYYDNSTVILLTR